MNLVFSNDPVDEPDLFKEARNLTPPLGGVGRGVGPDFFKDRLGRCRETSVLETSLLETSLLETSLLIILTLLTLLIL